MSNELRKEVLKTFKKLHKTRLCTFKGDGRALNYTRMVLNGEFKKNKHVSNQESIEALNKLALEVEHELRTSVVQAVKKDSGRYHLNIREEHLVDNIPLPGTPLPKPERRCGSKPPKTNVEKV